VRNHELIEWLRQFDQMAMVQVQCVGDRFFRNIDLEDSTKDASLGLFIEGRSVPYVVVLSAD
jgi:hypothetical protein